MPDLEELKRSFPLSGHWGEPTLFADTVSVRGVEIRLAGLSVESADGEMVTGSAAELSASPLHRAYFELLERASIVSFARMPDRPWPVRDSRGGVCGFVGSKTLFPESPDPARWRYARSNGVALGSSWAEACRSALAELVERDRVLRSWYGEFVPQRIPLDPGLVPHGLDELYSFEAYSFDDLTLSSMHVAGVLGFPCDDSSPLLYGFGARGEPLQALAAAIKECIQRLGFLWGEPIPEKEPEFSPGPDFHQEVFLRPATHVHLRRWLAGEHQALRPAWAEAPGSTSERLFADITPPALASKLYVAKAIPQDELPLVFGVGHPRIEGGLSDGLRVHPIA